MCTPNKVDNTPAPAPTITPEKSMAEDLYGDTTQSAAQVADNSNQNNNTGVENSPDWWTEENGWDYGKYGKGNIDLTQRPVVHNDDGSVSTTKSMSFEADEGKFKGKEVLVPTIREDGKVMTDKESIEHFYKTGKYLGVFDDYKEADKYSQKLHEDQAKIMTKFGVIKSGKKKGGK